jgi:hypothetical protein
MFQNFYKSDIKRNISNIPGWSTKQRFIVIESDDWGSIRMPSKEVYEKLIDEGFDLLSDEGFQYNLNDSLATSEDLESLFEVLASIKDSSGRELVITPVSVVANPDFEKIRRSDFQEYFYEPIDITLNRYPPCNGSFDLWKKGIENRLFVPQFHGREHLNVQVWMRALQNEQRLLRRAFDYGFWGVSTKYDPKIGVEVQAAFDFVDPQDLEYHKEVIISGLNLFEKLFNYRATHFVPPNGPFNAKLEEVCFNEGIKYLSVSKIQNEPLGNFRTKKRYHWIGQKSKSGLTYLTRNCFFEPVHPNKDWVNTCMSEISSAFRWRKPAVISSHRLNYIGALHKKNRDNGLIALKLLLQKIIKTWPDAEFLTSAELGEIICNEKHH